MIDLFINGKYALQQTTGVQRVAREIVAALDRRAARGLPTPRRHLLLPSPAAAGAARLHLWEQLTLPRAARSGLLLSLAGSAPAFGAGPQACVMHDAAVFDQPQAYSVPFVRWYRWLFRHNARRGVRLLTVSNFSRQRLSLALGVAPTRLTVLPLGADHLDGVAPDPGFVAAHGLDGRPFLLAVGSANPTKNLALLVRAWSLLDRRDAGLVIVGGSRLQVFAASDAGSAPGLTRLGAVGDAQLKALYLAARGLVFPSLYEGFGLPPLEAMACGCPVVAAAAASIPEVCGDAALLFDPHDTTAVAAALRRLLDDPDLCKTLRARGLARAAALRWDDTASALLAALGPAGAGT